MKKTVLLMMLVALSGCADQSISPELDSAAHDPLTCANKSQCDIYWSRVQIWVSQNSFFRIQTVTDTILNTYGPDQYNHIAYQINRIPNEDGSARIKINSGCDIPMLCKKQVYLNMVSLKNFVRDGQ
ncbi:MAG: hypothetical protein ACYC0M_15595 [Burkholderiales bacterium]